MDKAWWGEIADVNPRLYKVLDMAQHTGGKSAMSYLIYMSIRILEMHRILEQTGSIYLHCDSTMSHYLKMVMDAVFRVQNFRNEILWKRFSSHNDGKRYGKITDTILFYSKSNKYTWNRIYTPYSDEYIEENYRNEDQRGRYTHRALTAEGLSGGGYEYTFHGHHRVWKRPLESMRRLENAGGLYFPKKKDGVPRYKIYLDDAQGNPLQNIWTDIPIVGGNERLRYPTQKPLALMERIIQASSNKGDWVLDPFCGCATACSAAEKLDRKWIGIDISPKAYDLLRDRLDREAGLDRFTKGAGNIIHRTDIPIRKGKRSKNIKDVLYGKQMGICNLCKKHTEYRFMEVDHEVPKAKGGPDDDSNLQLLCTHCNKIKSAGTMAEARVRLKELGII